MIKICDLYPWLSDEQISENESFNSSYNVDNTVKESDILLSKKLNDEADILTPVMSNGWPMSDIDAINEVQDIRLQNVLIARLQPLGNDPENNLSDDELLESVIRRNLTSSEVEDYASEYKWLKDESLRLAQEIKDNRPVESSNPPANE